jgi:hypothetical protein
MHYPKRHFASVRRRRLLMTYSTAWSLKMKAGNLPDHVTAALGVAMPFTHKKAAEKSRASTLAGAGAAYPGIRNAMTAELDSAKHHVDLQQAVRTFKTKRKASPSAALSSVTKSELAHASVRAGSPADIPFSFLESAWMSLLSGFDSAPCADPDSARERWIRNQQETEQIRREHDEQQAILDEKNGSPHSSLDNDFDDGGNEVDEVDEVDEEDTEDGTIDGMGAIFTDIVVPYLEQSARYRYEAQQRQLQRRKNDDADRAHRHDNALSRHQNKTVRTQVDLTINTNESIQEALVSIDFSADLDHVSDAQREKIHVGKESAEGKEQLEALLHRANINAPELGSRVVEKLSDLARLHGPLRVTGAQVETSIISSARVSQQGAQVTVKSNTQDLSSNGAVAMYSSNITKRENTKRENTGKVNTESGNTKNSCQFSEKYTQHAQQFLAQLNTRGINQNIIAYPATHTAHTESSGPVSHADTAGNSVAASHDSTPAPSPQREGSPGNDRAPPLNDAETGTRATNRVATNDEGTANGHDAGTATTVDVGAVAGSAVVTTPGSAPYENFYPGDPLTDPLEEGYEPEFARQLEALMPGRFVLRKVNKGYLLVTREVSVREGPVARTPGLALGHYISMAVFIAFKGGEVQTTISEDNQHIVISSNEDKINRKIANAIGTVEGLRNLITAQLAGLGDQKAHLHRRRMYKAALAELGTPAFASATIHVPGEGKYRDRHGELRNEDYIAEKHLGPMRLPAGLKRPCFPCAMVLEENDMLEDRPIGYVWFGENSFMRPLGLEPLPVLPSKKELKRLGKSEAQAQAQLRLDINERARTDAQTFANKLQKLEKRRAFKTEMTKPQFSGKYGTDEPWSEDEGE